MMFASQITFTSSAQNSAEREISALSSSLESTINHLYNYAITASLNDSLIKTVSKYPDPPDAESEHYYITQTLNGILNSIIGLNSTISQWDILSENGSFFDVSGFQMDNITDFDPKSILQVHENSLKPQITGPYKLHTNRISSDTATSYVFILSKPIVRLDSNKTCGYIVFVIDATTISAVFEEYLPDNIESNFYIMAKDNTVLLSSNNSCIGTIFNDSDNAILPESSYTQLLEEQTYLTSQLDNRKLLYTLRELNDIDWKIVTAYPLSALSAEQGILSAIILITSIFSLFIFLFIAYFIARTISQPLRTLAGHMSQVEEESYETIIVPDNVTEVETLYNGYNYMMNKTKELLNSIYETNEEMNEYQFKLLQSQIKPHFLYNTLEMVKSMIDLEMYETASDAIIALSRFYRLSLNHGADIISIKEELEIAENYLKLEQMRHPEYFSYTIECDKSVYSYAIPKLTLQPILENSVIHGMINFSDTGLICIKIQGQNESIYFTVEDNGQGITEEELDQINNTINFKQSASSTQSFGLSNINRRLKILYGEEYHVDIESKRNQYTRFTIKIPKIKLEGDIQ